MSHLKEPEYSRKLCRGNAKKYNISKERADKCDEIKHPLCPICPFICK